MIADVVRVLRCPTCTLELEAGDGRLVCANGHSFDIARAGYVNLMRSAARGRHEGDSAEMVAARERFLGAGHYEPLARALHKRVPRSAAHVLDVGAGTGYYLRDMPGAAVALDASRYAAQRAARAHPRAGAVVCDVWRELPLRNACIPVALNVFAPRNGPELRRVLTSNGILLVVTPKAEHLRELAGVIGLLQVDELKEQRLLAELEPHFDAADREPVDFELRLERSDAQDLVQMGPSARHLGASDLDAGLGSTSWPLKVTAAMDLWTFIPNAR